MTTPSTAHLAALLQAARLPWSHAPAPYSSAQHHVSDGETGLIADMHRDDAALAVEAVNALPHLLARIASLEAEVARLTSERDRLGRLVDTDMFRVVDDEEEPEPQRAPWDAPWESDR